MKSIALYITLAAFIILPGCSENSNETETKKITAAGLQKLFEDALWGSSEANMQLSGIINPDTPPTDSFNKFEIDSFTVNGKKYFTVLIEYPVPVYNILAVYDDELNLYLYDNSLNGNIAVKWQKIGDKNFLIAFEKFISKDLLKLERLSLYAFQDSSLNLVYRAFSKLDKAGDVYTHTIDSIDDEMISTSIKSNKRSSINNKADVFYFDSDKKRYISSADIFNNFVMNEIKNAKWLIEKPELTIETAGKFETNEESTRQVTGTMNRGFEGFQIEINSDWKVVENVSVKANLKRKLTGTRFINENLGAQVTVFKLPAGKTAERYVRYKFGKPTQGDYKVRSTELIESGKNYIRFIEHSCGGKNFILMIEAPKNTYKANEKIYDDIETSFFIEC